MGNSGFLSLLLIFILSLSVISNISQFSRADSSGSMHHTAICHTISKDRYIVIEPSDKGVFAGHIKHGDFIWDGSECVPPECDPGYELVDGVCTPIECPAGQVLSNGICVDEDEKHGGDNQWDTRPTFGVSHEERSTQIVDNGFSFNGNSLTINDNHHTKYDQHVINVGAPSTFVAKVYASKGLKVQEFLFGVPEIGMGHLAEMRIEVWFDIKGQIDDVKVVQNSDVVDPSSLSVIHNKVKCSNQDIDKVCDSTMVSAIFLEPLKDKVMAIKAIDYKLRDQTTYLNEGFDISGKSLNPMDTQLIPSNVRNEGLLKITHTEKYSDYWISDDGRMFEMNKFGSFKEINQLFKRFQDKGEPTTRLHSGFANVVENEKLRALNVFNSTKLISELPDTFGYHYEFGERIDSALKNQMEIEEQKAHEILSQYLQARY